MAREIRDTHNLQGRSASHPRMPIETAPCLALIDWAASQLRADERGAIHGVIAPILATLGLQADTWQARVLGIERYHWRVVACAQVILENAAALGQGWHKGIGTARRQAQMAT